MNADNQKILLKIQKTLEQLLLGKPCAPIEEESEAPELNQVVELVNILIGNVTELNAFAHNLGKGNLDISVPGRRNYLASTLKELHSQLSSFVWSVTQLEKGFVVDRTDYMGELSDAFNALLAKVAGDQAAFNEVPVERGAVNSWRYHQLFMVFNRLQFIVIAADQNGRILFLNTMARERLGNLEYIRLLEEAEDNSNLMNALHSANGGSVRYPFYQEIYDIGTGHWFKVTTDQIPFPNSQAVYAHTVEDISEWKTSEKELKISATVDDLTSVFNRNVGIQALEAALVGTKALTTSCAAFIDIDGLKEINDNYGHNEGDYAIKSIANVLSASVRDSDTVSRFGGDEFLVVFYGCKLEPTETIIRRMYEKLDDINQTNGKPYKLSFSHGITQINTDTQANVQEIIMLMDKKMYERKAAKKALRPPAWVAQSDE